MTGIARVQPVMDWAAKLIFTHTSNPVGDGQAPPAASDAEDSDPYPYGVLHHITATRWGAFFANPDGNLDLTVQFDAVGRRVDQARYLSDRAREALLERDSEGTFTHDADAELNGWRVADRAHQSGPMPPSPEGQPPDRVFTIVERYIIRVVSTQGDTP